MTSRALVPVEAEVLERMAEKSGRMIELGKDHAYLTLGPTTFVAEIPAPEVGEVPC